MAAVTELNRTTQDKLKMSVIIVTRNRADMLRDTLSSLIGQSRAPDEVIVVDNNSTDHTKKTAEEFRNSLRLKYVFEERRGIAKARNAGVRNSTGDIIVFTDDDCVADKDWLYYLEFPFLRDPSVGMAGGEIYPHITEGSIIEKYCAADHLMRVSY